MSAEVKTFGEMAAEYLDGLVEKRQKVADEQMQRFKGSKGVLKRLKVAPMLHDLAEVLKERGMYAEADTSFEEAKINKGTNNRHPKFIGEPDIQFSLEWRLTGSDRTNHFLIQALEGGKQILIKHGDQEQRLLVNLDSEGNELAEEQLKSWVFSAFFNADCSKARF